MIFPITTRSVLRSMARRPALMAGGSSSSTRQIHHLPALSNQSRFEAEGIAGLYSPAGFRNVWTEYQQYLVDELSRQTAETEHETRTPFGIMLNTAEKMLDASLFNHASQAHNNHLFMEALRPAKGSNTSHDTNPTQPSAALLKRIEETFGSLEGLKEEVLDIATGPYTLGAGWIFLVETDSKMLDLVHTFQAGSPYFAGRSQQNDFNLAVSSEAVEELEQIKTDILDKQSKEYTMPLLAINLWEVAYLADYGVGGRAEYVNNVWKALDWDVINKRFYGN